LATRHAAFGSLLHTVGRAVDARPDARLLADFFAHRDEAAFATLVRRHQRTVWAVCARTLPDQADAEDAFQATFLVLARSGQLLADGGGVGGWLYRVAERVARKARIMATNRKRRERRAGRPEAVTDRPADDLFEVVSTELDRLPENHRLAVIVCDLDGLSRSAAAARLGWTEGTLSARLHRGRRELAERLRARGVTAPLVGLASVFATTAALPVRAADATAELACVVIESGLTCRAVPATVAALVSQTTREMAMRITTKVLAVLTLAAGVFGFGWLGLPGGDAPRATAAPVPEVKKAATPEVPPTAYPLLRLGKVQKELKCSAEQRVALIDHFDDMADAAAAKGPGGVNLVIGPGANPAAIQQQIEAQIKERRDAEAAECKAAAEKILKPSQLLRLVQIELQVRGAEAFTDPKVADTLKLTDDQKKAIGEVIEVAKGGGNLPVAAGGPVQPPIAGGGGIVFARGVSLFDPKARKATYEKAVETLTAEQKAAWKTMTGEAATFDPHTLYTMSGSGSISVRGGMMAAPAMPAMPVVQGVPLLPAAPPQPPKKDDK
jgi:RNA polymerase sigma factor (sigma-70 family)